MKTFTQISTENITSEQIGTCYKFYIGSKAAYKVASQSTPDTEYTVSHTKEKGFQCTCKAGQNGFSSCKKYGVCTHVRIAVATEKEVRQALAGLETPATIIVEESAEVPTLIIDGKAADLDTITRVFVEAKPRKTSHAKGYAPKAFSILK